jgi:CBS domain-containing protein
MVGKDVTVADIMTTALLTVSPEEPIESVEFAMKMANVRHVPVVGPHNRLVGVISDRDILRASSGPASRPIAEIMSRKVRTVGPDDLARQALEALLADRIGCVPVVANDRQLIGIVTESSFLRLAREALAS